jgi:hypothetical protein
MEIGSVGSGVEAQAAVAVQRKALDNQRQIGAMALRLIESARTATQLPPDSTISVHA